MTAKSCGTSGFLQGDPPFQFFVSSHSLPCLPSVTLSWQLISVWGLISKTSINIEIKYLVWPLPAPQEVGTQCYRWLKRLPNCQGIWSREWVFDHRCLAWVPRTEPGSSLEGPSDLHCQDPKPNPVCWLQRREKAPNEESRVVSQGVRTEKPSCVQESGAWVSLSLSPHWSQHGPDYWFLFHWPQASLTSCSFPTNLLFPTGPWLLCECCWESCRAWWTWRDNWLLPGPVGFREALGLKRHEHQAVWTETGHILCQPQVIVPRAVEGRRWA